MNYWTSRDNRLFRANDQQLRVDRIQSHYSSSAGDDGDDHVADDNDEDYDNKDDDDGDQDEDDDDDGGDNWSLHGKSYSQAKCAGICVAAISANAYSPTAFTTPTFSTSQHQHFPPSPPLTPTSATCAALWSKMGKNTDKIAT